MQYSVFALNNTKIINFNQFPQFTSNCLSSPRLFQVWQIPRVFQVCEHPARIVCKISNQDFIIMPSDSLLVNAFNTAKPNRNMFCIRLV